MASVFNFRCSGSSNTTWKSGLSKIATAKEFKGELGKSSWLLNEDIAFIYRAYATYDRPLKITSPDPMSAQGEAWDAGSSVTIVVDDSKFTGWEKLELSKSTSAGFPSSGMRTCWGTSSAKQTCRTT